MQLPRLAFTVKRLAFTVNYLIRFLWGSGLGVGTPVTNPKAPYSGTWP